VPRSLLSFAPQRNNVAELPIKPLTRIDPVGIVSAGSGLVDVERVFPGSTPLPAEPVVAAEPPAPAVIETPVVAQENAGLWLQLGAFSSAESAESFKVKNAPAPSACATISCSPSGAFVD